jgi:hypothetical protein
MIRALVIAACLLVCLPASAARTKRLPKPPLLQIDCVAVRDLVSRYGAVAVEEEARSRHVSEIDIGRAKKCLIVIVR